MAVAVAVPVAVVVAVHAFDFVQGLIMISRSVATECRVRLADHKAVAAGCREILQHRREYSNTNTRADWPTNGCDYIDFTANSIDNRIPRVIRDLHPWYAMIDSNSVFLVLYPGVHLRYAEGGKEYGVMKLAEGLWRIDD